LITRCVNTAEITLDFAPKQVPSPDIEIVSHRTDCMTPDGVLQALMERPMKDFIINWYDGDRSSEGSPINGVPDHTGEFYRSLDTGPYTATAFEIMTGCTSDPVVATILPFMEVPEFTIEITPTSCEQDIGALELTATNDVEVAEVRWSYHPDDPNAIDPSMEFASGSKLSSLAKGYYLAQITTLKNCYAEQVVQVLPEVLVFNGVSYNGDGMNEIFEIACIEDFPNNSVKIFNRAGTLVYEAKGYNNADVSFSGVSNKGINLLGTNLPEGTYFYIIDKGDGSVPRTGYLELLR